VWPENGIIFQYLTVDRLHAERHLRLLVDEDQLRVLRGQDFQFWVHHHASR